MLLLRLMYTVGITLNYARIINQNNVINVNFASNKVEVSPLFVLTCFFYIKQASMTGIMSVLRFQFNCLGSNYNKCLFV